MTKSEVYPEFMVVKQGKIVAQDSAFAILSSLYGISGTGSVIQDTTKVFGGTGAAKVSTTAVNGEFESIKRNLPFFISENGLLAFELKYIPDPQFSANKLVMGFEVFIAGVGQLEGKVIYDQNTKSIQIQTGPGTFAPLDPPLLVQQPTVEATTEGDLYGWLRIVIDITKKEYVSIESHGLLNKEFRGVKGTPLNNVGPATVNGVAAGLAATNAGAAITDTYTTDWILSEL